MFEVGILVTILGVKRRATQLSRSRPALSPGASRGSLMESMLWYNAQATLRANPKKRERSEFPRNARLFQRSLVSGALPPNDRYLTPGSAEG